MPVRRTTLAAIGFGRTGERSAKVPRRLQDEIAAGAVHPVQHEKVAAGLDAGQRRGPARLDLDRADRIGLARILRALLAAPPWRADAADEVDLGIELVRERHRHFTR